MYYSFYLKSVFDLAKKSKNVICLNYTENHFLAYRECVLLDFIERDDEETFEKKVELYLKDVLNENDEKIMKLDVSQLQNFIVTGNNSNII